MGLPLLHVEQVSACSVEPLNGPLPLGKRGLFEAFLKVATIKKTPVLKREELYQGLIEPGWGAGLWIPLREESGTFFV